MRDKQTDPLRLKKKVRDEFAVEETFRTVPNLKKYSSRGDVKGKRETVSSGLRGGVTDTDREPLLRMDRKPLVKDDLRDS